MADVNVAGLILAAGKGTRMKSDLPKCLHSVCGLPMVEHIGRAMRAIGVARPVLVVGFKGELLVDVLGNAYEYAWQTEQLGTAHAAIMAKDFLENHQGPILITPGDAPLLDADILQRLVDLHVSSGALATVGTCELDDATGYGRIVRDSTGRVLRIVEHKDASDDEREIREINSAVYCFDGPTLFRILPTLSNNNAQGEFYLPDVIERISNEGGSVEALIFNEDFFTFQGVNDRWQLAQAARVMRDRISKRHAMNGVTIVDPSTTYISADAEIGIDTVVHPMTTIEGKSVIGAGCHIGPMSVVVESQIGDEVTILMSHVNRAEMKDGSRCGPYAHLRPAAKVGERTRVGNFVEIKNAVIGDQSAVSHLSYIGDARIGNGTNIGAGTITCNFDGVQKHVTQIGDGVFVGSNSTLVAPISIGNEGFVAAGSVVTEDVPEASLAIGRSRQEVKRGWVERRKKQMESK